MDISEAILAKSDMLTAQDFIDPVTVTITGSGPGKTNAEVRVTTDVFGPDRPFQIPTTLLRQIGKGWGKDTTVWHGRRMTLHIVPTVKYGGEVRGGVRVSAMSHIDKPIRYTPPAADGLPKGTVVTIQPLPDAAPTVDPTPHLDAITRADSIDALKQAWQQAVDAGLKDNPQILAATNKRKTDLTTSEQEITR